MAPRDGGSPSPQRHAPARSPAPSPPPAAAAASPKPPPGHPPDPALAAAGVVRPKVLFPPIARTGNPDDPGGDGAGGGGGVPPPPAAFASLSGASPPRSPMRPRTGRGGLMGRSKSARSQATSLWAAPGSPIAPPDSREQFLIWLDSTFAADAAAADDGLGGGGAGGLGYQAEAARRRQRRIMFEEQWGLGGGAAGGEEGAGGPGGGGGAAGPRGLQRLLCRPLHHLWQDSPEAFARQGNARWSPQVSEYREARGGYTLHPAARPLLQVVPPAPVAATVVAGTTQVLSTGKLSAELTSSSAPLTLERPSTAQRGQGRCPLTVLQPRPELIGASGQAAAEPGGTMAAAAAGAAAGGRGSARATGEAAPRLSASGDAAAAGLEPGGGAERRATRGVTIAEAAETLGDGAEQQQQAWGGPISLKIALSPQRPRTLLAFDDRVFTTDSAGLRAVLTLFERVEGSKVGEGLFTEYTLPNGRKAYMYCSAGSIMDEAEIGPVQPPPRPTTVPLALQQSMPLAEVLDFIAQPPGTAPPYVPHKPVPRLVPLPARHTLPVRRRSRLDAEAFGALREDALRLVITANPILKTTSTTTEEDVYVPAREEREPWSLPMSIFKARAKEADARAFHDGTATLDKMFERDWGRACAKEKFMAALARENRGAAGGKPDKVALAEVHDALKRHYQAFVSAFTYYAAQGGNDPYHLPLNAFTSFLDDAGIPDGDSQFVKRSDCDTIFIVAAFVADKKTPDYEVMDEHAVMRFQFMEAIVRLAIAKYGKGQETDDLATAVEALLARNLEGRLPPMARLVPNDFRSERLYAEEVDLLLKKNQVMLKALYSRYRLKPVGGGLRPKSLRLDGWLAFMGDAGLVDAQFTLSDATMAFLWSRMHVIDEVKDYARYTSLTFTDFLEALGRAADAKSLPTASDLADAGYSSILEWALDKERLEGSADQSSGTAARASATGAEAGAPPAAAEGGGGGAAAQPAAAAAPAGGGGGSVPPIFRTRPSARFGAPKPRPLYAKLELLLDLAYRRLYWDPQQPESAFSVDALLRAVRKVDKDLGP